MTVVADMPATIDSIVASSDLPMSIVIVGVHGPVSVCIYVVCSVLEFLAVVYTVILLLAASFPPKCSQSN
jgi:hypothetical protein